MPSKIHIYEIYMQDFDYWQEVYDCYYSTKVHHMH